MLMKWMGSLLLLFSLLAPLDSDGFAQTSQELSEPDNTYLMYYKDRASYQHPSSRPFTRDSVFTVLGRWAWGYCLAVDTRGSYAFIGNGPTFQTLDMTNPASPVIVGECIVTDRINDIVVRDSLAYVAMAQGLVVMDITDPTHPQQLGELYLSGVPQQLAVEGTMAYVLSWGTGMTNIVDVSDPSSPIRRSGVVAGEFAYCIGARAGFVYLGVTSAPVMRIVDATNPDSISYRDTSLAFFGRTAITEDTLLLIGATSTIDLSRRLKVFSVANPGYPRLLGEVVIPGRSNNTGNVRVVGTKAYIAALDTGVVEVDLGNPSQPQIRRILNRKPLFSTAGITSVSGLGIASLGEYILVPYYTGLVAARAMELDSLREVSFFPTGGLMFDVRVRNNIAYVASALSGLWLVDVSDPNHPRAISNVQNGGPVTSVVLWDSVALLVNTPGSQNDSTRGLWTVDLTNTSSPDLLGHYVGISSSLPSFTAANPAASMGRTIIAGRRNGFQNDSTLELVDASNPRNLRRLSLLRGSYSPAFIALKDSIVYVSTSDSGLMIIDAHLPSSPYRIGKMYNYSGGLTVSDTLLIVMADSLYTLSVTNPAIPARLGSITPNIANAISFKMAIARRFLYLAERNVLAYDISLPAAPVEVGVLQTLTQATGVAASNDGVFAIDAFWGLWALRNNLITSAQEPLWDSTPNQLSLDQNFPNPFNPVTSISFYLPRREQINLELYNVLGQRLKTLVDDEMSAGSHRIMLDASQFPSGVCYYRLISSLGSITRKMVLIK